MIRAVGRGVGVYTHGKDKGKGGSMEKAMMEAGYSNLNDEEMARFIPNDEELERFNISDEELKEILNVSDSRTI